MTDGKMFKFRKLLSSVLLIFTILSIGYMLGKNSAEKQFSVTNNPGGGNYIAVYYLHSTFRCETCNTIENMTKILLNTNYSSEIQSGDIIWQEIDFMKNHDLAEQFDVVASCVVVAMIDQGEVQNFKRLDEVWTLMANPVEFNEYISKAIDTYLRTGASK